MICASLNLLFFTSVSLMERTLTQSEGSGRGRLIDHATIPSTEFYELEPAAKPVVVTDAVLALGYPLWGYGERLNIRTGEVSSLTVQSLVQKIEVTQQLTQGMSGGPILNAAGEVIGIIHKGGPDEGRQLAVRLSELELSLKDAEK